MSALPYIIVCCGEGGVGKTTSACAIAFALAQEGRRTLLMTIDPARRLADALGAGELTNEPTPVPLPPEAQEHGTLHALMLDQKQTWDQTMHRLSADPETTQELLHNRYYRAVTTRLTGSHEYMAAERLHQLVTERQWDVIVVDTPPSQHALDFLDAPERLGRLLDRSLVSRLKGQGVTGFTTNRVLSVLGRLVGKTVLKDIAEFFRLISSASTALNAHAQAVQGWMRSPHARFVVVTTPSLVGSQDALDLITQLDERSLNTAVVFLNRYEDWPPVKDLDFSPPDDVPLEAWNTTTTALKNELKVCQRIFQTHRQVKEALQMATNRPVIALPLLDVHVGTVPAIGQLAHTLTKSHALRHIMD